LSLEAAELVPVAAEAVAEECKPSDLKLFKLQLVDLIQLL
jgi:hypothetical protein